MPVTVISRETWGATPWKGTVYSVPASERTEFFVHYHGAPPSLATGFDVPRNVEAIHLANGWAGVGYNFMVDQEGVAYEGRGWDLVGAHSPKNNRSGWGTYIAIGGDQEPTPAALATVRALYDEGCERAAYALAKKGHRDGKPTACPGDILYAWVQAGMPAGEVVAAPVAVGDGDQADTPILRKGSRGRHVGDLQRQLADLGYDVGAVDEDFGPRTEAAVKALQGFDGQPVDGIVGPRTRDAIARGVRPPPPPAAHPALPTHPAQLVEDGSLGPKTIARWQEAMGTPVDGKISKPSALIDKVQHHLQQWGYTLHRDGKLGPKTIRAIQMYLGVTQDGVLGPVTVTSLQRRLNAGRF